MQKDVKKTMLNSWHKENGGQMVEFGGWEMPVAYGAGIIEEHLHTRRYAGLFDISHIESSWPLSFADCMKPQGLRPVK